MNFGFRTKTMYSKTFLNIKKKGFLSEKCFSLSFLLLFLDCFKRSSLSFSEILIKE